MRAWTCQFLFLAGTALAGCTTPATIAPLADSELVWPAPPDAERIRFVREFSGPADLDIQPSLWNRLTNITTGAVTEELARPMAVAASQNGQLVYVADPGKQCVHRFDLHRKRYRCLVTEQDTVLVSPVGLAIGDDGTLYVADSGLNAVFKAAPGDKELQPLVLTPAPVQPTGIAIDPSGDLFVVSTSGHRILRYERDGQLNGEHGGRGSEPGLMNYPTYLWLGAESELLVSDTMNFRVQRFDPDDGVLSIFGEAGDGSGSFARPKGIAMDRAGHIYVVDGMHHAIQIFDQDGQLLLSFGEQGNGPGQFWLPSGIFVTEDNLIYVADAYNSRVQIFHYVGEEQ